MTEVRSLLPPNASPVMRALSEVFTEASTLPAMDLAGMWDPRRCPAGRLPSLAADLGVQLWKPEWPETKKRRVIARSIALMRRRGTVPAFAESLSFVGAELVQFRAPPQRAIVKRHPTLDEREAWARQFPLLTVTYGRARHVRPRRLVAGRCWGASRRTASRNIAAAYMGPRATLTRGGATSPVRIRRVGDHLQVAMGDARRPAFTGHTLGRGWKPKASRAAGQTYAFRFGERRAATVSPGKPAVDIRASLTPLGGPRTGQLVAGAAFGGRRRFVRSSRASERVGRSVRLFDPSMAARGLLRPRSGLIAGRTILGQPAFQLRLAVDLKHRRRGRRAWPFSWRGVLRAHDPSRLADGLAAVRAVKLGRDQVLVRTGLYRPIAAGDGVPLDGSHRLGQIVRSL